MTANRSRVDVELGDISAPLVHRAPQRARVFSTARYEQARDAIGPLASGCELVIRTHSVRTAASLCLDL